jgi:hypothetical protein
MAEKLIKEEKIMFSMCQPIKKLFFILVLISVMLLLYPLISPASKGGEDGSSTWEASQGFIEVTQKAMPAVVFIQVEKN